MVKGSGRTAKIFAPHVVAEHVFALIGKIDIDDVVLIRPADALGELQAEYLVVLAQVPKIRLVPRQARAVDARLLPSAPTPIACPSAAKQTELDCVYLSVMREMMRSVAASCGRSLFLVTMFFNRSASILNSLRPCSKVMPNTCLRSMGSGR